MTRKIGHREPMMIPFTHAGLLALSIVDPFSPETHSNSGIIAKDSVYCSTALLSDDLRTIVDSRPDDPKGMPGPTPQAVVGAQKEKRGKG